MSADQVDHFSFTKLLVKDLEATSSFYKSACGLTEVMRLQAKSGLDGRMMDEIILTGQKGAGSLILVSFGDAPQPQTEVILGFATPNLASFIDRAKAAGGSLISEPYSVSQGNANLRTAYIADPEGHALEVIEGA